MDTTNPERIKLIEQGEREWNRFLDNMRKYGPDNLFLFNKYALQVEEGGEGFVPLADFHKELCYFVTDRTDKKKLLLLPRGHLKTKLVTIGRSTQRIIKDPKVRVLIYSGTWQMAVDIQTAIQKALKQELIVEIYGDFYSGATEWRADRTRLRFNDKREPTITAAGIDNNMVGGHYDLIIMDDVVTRENTNTIDQIKKTITRYKDALDLLEPGGELIVIGTRWHDLDLYGWILDPDNDIVSSYNVMIKEAYSGNIVNGEDFAPLWPQKFSIEELRRRLREEGWYHFSAQYMNNPVPEEDAIFKRDNFRYYDEDILKGKLLNKFLTVDPALSLKRDSDFSALVVVGMDEYRNLYVLDMVRKRMTPSDIINEIFRLREKWDLTDIGIELVAYQQALAYALRDDLRFRARPFHITELRPNERTKDQRIKGLQPLYENGMVYHNKYLDNNIYLEDELVRFPRSSHDDLIDAFSYVLDFIYPSRQALSGRNRSRRRYLY